MGEPIRVRVDASLRDLVPGFLANRRKDLEAIGEGLRTGDLELIHHAGRNLRSFARVYGFCSLIALGEELQEALEARDLTAIQRIEERLADYLDRIELADDASGCTAEG